MKAGDLVRMKSGGPTMTVKQVSEQGHTAYCRWFSGRALRGKVFAFEEIVPVEPDQEGGGE